MFRLTSTDKLFILSLSVSELTPFFSLSYRLADLLR
jgi:hypothetical protein